MLTSLSKSLNHLNEVKFEQRFLLRGFPVDKEQQCSVVLSAFGRDSCY